MKIGIPCWALGVLPLTSLHAHSHWRITISTPSVQSSRNWRRDPAPGEAWAAFPKLPPSDGEFLAIETNISPIMQ